MNFESYKKNFAKNIKFDRRSNKNNSSLPNISNLNEKI